MLDTKAGKISGKTERAKELNNHLTSLQVKVFEARRTLMEGNSEISAESLKNLLTGQGEKPKLILNVFQQHNDQMRELVNQEFAPGTLQRYTTSLKHTRDFINWKYQRNDLEVCKLDFDFLTDYEFWLKSVQNHAGKNYLNYLATSP